MMPNMVNHLFNETVVEQRLPLSHVACLRSLGAYLSLKTIVELIGSPGVIGVRIGIVKALLRYIKYVISLPIIRMNDAIWPYFSPSDGLQHVHNHILEVAS